MRGPRTGTGVLGHDLVALLLLMMMAVQGCGEKEPPLVQTFDKFECAASPADLGITGVHDPYDPDQIRVDAVLSHPDGTEQAYPCFWYVPCEQYFERGYSEEAGKEVDWERFRRAGNGEWRLRVCPQQPGAYRYSYRIATPQREWTRPGGAFVALARDDSFPGPIRVGEGSRYFRHSNGEPFVPIGQNLGWPLEDGSRTYADWLRLLSDVGANCGRLWLVHYMGGTALEWSQSAVNDGYKGVGHYSQESAARVDRILDAAAANNMYLILSFYSFGDTNWDWKNNPYSEKAGGWLPYPEQFFTDDRARAAARNRLRYAVARYGWSPRLWAWELWNEVETSYGYVPDTAYDWHEEMAGYLKSIDAHQHLVTTSYRFTPPYTSCRAYALADIDFIQVHTYLPQLTRVFPSRVGEVWDFGKPVVIAEYGLGVSPDYFDADPAGLHIHDGLWAGVFSGSAGTGMTWWWERYVHPRDLYFHYAGISRFLRGEDLEGAEMRRTSVDDSGEGHFSFALETGSALLAWVGMEREVTYSYDDWKRRVTAYECRAEGGPLKLRVEGDFDGTRQVLFYDTFDGAVIGSATATGGQGALTIPVPRFRHDVALKCFPGESTSGSPAAADETPVHDKFENLHGGATR